MSRKRSTRPTGCSCRHRKPDARNNSQNGLLRLRSKRLQLSILIFIPAPAFQQRASIARVPRHTHAMLSKIRIPGSLKARITLFMLVIFVASLWSLTLYASRMLR